jgi:chromate transporter
MTSDTPGNLVVKTHPTKTGAPTFGQLLTTFLKLGLTAFSFAILPQIRRAITRKAWLNEDELDEGIALTQLYPGPSNFDLVAYVGFRLKGVLGALTTTLSFVLPSFLLLVVLSFVYFTYGNLVWVQNIFHGLEALVVGIIVNLVIDMGGKYTRKLITILLAVITFFATIYRINIFLILVFSILVGVIGLQPMLTNQPINRLETKPDPKHITWIGISVVVVFIFTIVTICFFLKNDLGNLALSLFKVGSIAFGNGATILPVVRSEVVDIHHWFTPVEFADGTVLGQITPGPFLITAAFLGFKMGGVLGSLLCTFAVFSPTFAMTLIFTQLFSRVRNLIWIQKALAGVLAAFVGLLALITFQMAQVGFRSWISVVMAVLSFVACRFLKWDVLWVILAGLAIWVGIILLGIPI